MTEQRKGLLALVTATVIWGLSSLYYAQFRHMPPIEVLCYRSLWSLLFFGAILLFQGRIGQLWQSVNTIPKLGIVATAALLIAANWFGFIFAIKFGYAVEASLGYYIFPIVAVLLGRVFLGERLSIWQLCAVGLATAAVIILTAGLGVPPWIALGLAGTFGIYGLIKKRITLGPVLSVTAEVLVLAPFVVFYLVIWGARDLTLWTHVLLFGSGPLTGVTLVLFAYGSRRVALSTVGIMQYINPTLQFIVATTVFLEPFTVWHQIAFALIWTGVGIYCVAAIRQDRSARKAASREATLGTVVT
ncbi:RarD protein [Marivivens niveibacter]|uniref:RarD protein n=1 Tax=Marivivens niveibacter TaxID=1930667 RepID=A0A251X237_9RHOB|nr:EamA family transporter RarD [Marivivens niveibacter]OUD10641.1 RarD protein [Marivivens niveibacter]